MGALQALRGVSGLGWAAVSLALSSRQVRALCSGPSRPVAFQTASLCQASSGVSASSILKRSPYKNPREDSGAVTRAGKGLGARRGDLPQETPGPAAPVWFFALHPPPRPETPQRQAPGPSRCPQAPLWFLCSRCLTADSRKGCFSSPLISVET